MSDVDTRIEQDIETILQRAQEANDNDRDIVFDVLTFFIYGKDVLSQFGLGLDGFALRQSRTNVLLTVKVHEKDTPLVAFVTSPTTIGSVDKFLDLLYESKLKWQRDKYPWV